MKVNAKRLILSFIIAWGNKPLAVQNLIYACSLFGISGGTVRVNIARLVSESCIKTTGRGYYELCSEYSDFSDNILRWRTALDQLIPWSGDWLAVYCGNLGRTNRKQNLSRERALKLVGFRALEKDLYIRPDNLAGGVGSIRSRLYDLGLDEEALVFKASELANSHDELANLWDTRGLIANYDSLTRKLATWLANIDQLNLKQAATESFIYGENAIRLMVFDPLLPEQLIDTGSRESFFRTLIEFDKKGHELWHSILDS